MSILWFGSLFVGIYLSTSYLNTDDSNTDDFNSDGFENSNSVIPKDQVIDKMAGMDHSHMPIEIPAGFEHPKFELVLSKDKKDGFNLHLNLQDFNIGSPDEKNIDVEIANNILNGHAHLYINSKKIQRIYGLDVHLPNKYFNDGVNQVMISLNSHDHMIWTYKNKQVLASMIVQPNKKKFLTYQFSSFPM